VPSSKIEISCNYCGGALSIQWNRIKPEGNSHRGCSVWNTMDLVSWIDEREKLLTPVNLAWLAGLLEGEGTFQSNPPRTLIGMTDYDIILRVSVLLGENVLIDNGSKYPKAKTMFRVNVSSLQSMYLWPKLYQFMGHRRKESMDEGFLRWHFKYAPRSFSLEDLGLA
jgi:hypothetical protein